MERAIGAGKRVMRLLALFIGGESVADGRITIDTKIDTKGIITGTDDVIKAARRMAAQVDGLSASVRSSFARQADSILKASRAYQEQEDKVAGLRQKLEELKSQQIPTDEYKTLEAEIKRNEDALDRLIEKQIRFVETGGKTNSTAFERMEYDIEQARQKLDELRAAKERMETDGTAFSIGSNTAAIESTTAKLAHEEAVLEEKNRSLSTSYDALKNKVEEYGNKIAGAGNETKKAADETGKLSNAANKTGVSMIGSVKTLLKYSLGIRSLYALVNKLRAALIEGFKNLAQYSTNTNAALSGLMSSLSQCKNALATAFDPILQAIAPALNYMIGLVTAAATAVAQLIAILTGKGTFIKATKVQKDYAKSLKGTGGAAKGAGKDAEGALAPFDRLNVLAEEGAGGGGGGGGGVGSGIEDMFETVPVDNNITKAIDAIKAKLAELKNLFMAGFWEGLGDLSVFDSIKENIKSIRDSLVDIFSDGAVQAAANNMLNTLAYDMGRITGSFASIGLTIADNITGGFSKYLNQNKERIKKYLISMFDITSSISTIVANFTVAFAEIFSAFKSEPAKQFTADIIKMFSDAFMGVTELSGKLARDVLDIILNPFTNNAGKIKTAVENTIKPIETVFGTFAESVGKTFDRINQMYDEHLAPLFISIRNGFSEIVGTFVEGYNQYFSPVLDKLATKFSNIWKNHIQPTINNAIDVIGKVSDVVKVFWEEMLQPFINWIVENIFPVISPIIEGLGLAFEESFGLMSDVVNELLTTLGEILDFITKVFQGDWEGAWEAVKSSFDRSISAFPEKAQEVVNRITKIFSDMVTGIKESMKELLSIDGMASPGILTKNLVKPRSAISPSSEPIHLPRLASGTVVPPRAGEFAAILGDNRREAEVVSPLSTIKQALVEAIAQSGGMGGGDITARIYLDGRELGRSTVNFVRDEKNRTGQNPLLV